MPPICQPLPGIGHLEGESLGEALVGPDLQVVAPVSLSGTSEIVLDTAIEGDTAREGLDYAQFNSDTLLAQLWRDLGAALREGRIGCKESGRRPGAGVGGGARSVIAADPALA
jgi:hypothetical protein